MRELKRERRPTTPGAILKSFYLSPRKIRINQLADAIDVSTKHLSRIVNGHERITPTMAMRLSKALSTSPQLWLNAQAATDGYEAEQAARHWEPKTVFEPA